MNTPWHVVAARHALHHRRLSWEYYRESLSPPLPRHGPEYRKEAKTSRENAWWWLRHAIGCRALSEARQRRMSR